MMILSKKLVRRGREGGREIERERERGLDQGRTGFYNVFLPYKLNRRRVGKRNRIIRPLTFAIQTMTIEVCKDASSSQYY